MSTLPPDTRHLKLGGALDRSEPLANLLRRVQSSRERFAAISGLLPPALRSIVRPGPLDDDAWLLLVDHAAAAAKLRQMLPQLQSTLADHGWPEPAVKVTIQPRN